MRPSLSRFVLVTILASLAACSSVDSLSKLQPGISTEADATALAHRKPDYVWTNTDGSRTLDYSSQPLDGFSSWMVTVGSDGKVLRREQILVDTEKTNIVPGMTRDEVRRSLGTPRGVANFQLSGEEVWDWNTVNGNAGYLVRYNVHFKDGKVVRTTTRTITHSY